MPDPALPSIQHPYPGLKSLDEATLYHRRETVFLIFAGIFLGSLAMLNVLGITRFLNLAFFIDGSDTWKYQLAIAVGVLPYPVTFLCTDFISELYGRRRANTVVLVGLLINIWVVLILWVGGGSWWAFEGDINPLLPDVSPNGGRTFFEVRSLAFAAVTASMIAYLAAQLVDVHVFHFWKNLTNGRHLWLRNNGSTLVSQLVDTTAVIFVTFGAALLSGERTLSQLLVLIATGYVFKVIIALLDTIPFYIGAVWLSRFLRMPPPTHAPHPPAGAAVEAGVG